MHFKSGYIACLRTRQIFSVIPDPACGAWDSPRAKEDEEAPEDVDAFGDLRRSPGARPALTVEGWIAHWQMVGAAFRIDT